MFALGWGEAFQASPVRSPEAERREVCANESSLNHPDAKGGVRFIEKERSWKTSRGDFVVLVLTRQDAFSY